MISVQEAKEIIDRNIAAMQPAVLPLLDTCGLTLAEDVYAKSDIPSFEQSSMDGYAFLFEEKNLPLTVQNEIAAGDPRLYRINSMTAARIFTGAPLPEGADTVVMQEKVRIEQGKILIQDIHLKKGDYVRRIGAEIKSGELALQKKTVLNPVAIGFLAGIGIGKVCVFPSPNVSIIITGNELQIPGKDLAYGQVYESNSVSLSGALRQAGISNICVLYASDEPDIVESVLKNALEKSDVILLTGGISAGDYDFVLGATEHCEVVKHFHKIKQKPGKPLYFGTKENKIVFGLPGNPASVLTCFYEYVLPALEKLMVKKSQVKKTSAILQDDYSKKSGMTHFLKGLYESRNVTVLKSQASFQLSSFALANCLIIMEEQAEEIKKGEEVEVHLLPM